jgi:uncharacterized protein (DUF58 family)
MYGLRKWVYRSVRQAFFIGQWIRRRFTRTGLTVLGGLMVAGILGLDTDQNVAYQAFGLMLSLLVVAIFSSGRFRGRLEAHRLLPRFGTVASPLIYQVLIRNLGSGAQIGLRMQERLADEFPSLEEFIALQTAEEKRYPSFRVRRRSSRLHWSPAKVPEQAVPDLPAKLETATRMELLPLRRGRLRFRALVVARLDPLGLFKALRAFPRDQSVTILPRRYYVPPLAMPGSRKYNLGGVALASSVGESEEFVSLRDYRQGDPLRHIHWRSWAKTGKPIVREFEDEFFVRHALILDTFTDHPQSAVFEEAVSVAASFACTLNTQDSLLDLMFVGPEAFCFTIGRGLAQTEQMLEILASVHICRERSFSALRELVLDHIGTVSGCVCVFLAWDELRRDFVNLLKQAGIPMKILVVVESGFKEQLDPGPVKDQPGVFHVLEVGSIGEGLAKL